ncbi:hypothetical protein ACXIUT_19345 [Achromobacter denitrificans]|jgi:hypothetical protein
MQTIAYHVTAAPSLASILQEGIRPAIGPRSELLGEKRAASYFFASAEACEDGLSNWLGEHLEDDELHILRVDLSGLQIDDALGWEISCYAHVPATRIVEVLSESEFEDYLAQSERMIAVPGSRQM